MDDKGSWDFPWLPTSVSLGLSDMVWSETRTKCGLSFHVVGEVLPHLSSQSKDDRARRVTVPTQVSGATLPDSSGKGTQAQEALRARHDEGWAGAIQSPDS